MNKSLEPYIERVIHGDCLNRIGIYEVKLRVIEHRVGYSIVAADSEAHARTLAKRQEHERTWAQNIEVEIDEVSLVSELALEGVARE